MAKASASALDAEPRLPKAGRTTVGDRVLLALRPPGLSSGPLRWLGLAMLALAAIFPLVGGPFYTRLGIETLLLGAVAMSVDILLGHAGLLSLGQAAYFGLAAYVSALMYLHVTQSFWLVLLTVMAVVGVFSLLLGAVAIRAKGVYFALITFGAAEILSKIAHNTRAIGGSDGLLGIPIPAIPLLPGIALDLHSNLVFYYAVLAALVLIYLGTRRVLATAFGAVLRAIRDNPDRVPYLGYNPFWYKLMAYVMAAQVAAFGGLVYPLLRGFVAPDLLGFEVSTKAVVMSLVGGVGTLLGPLAGSAIITFLESLVGSYTERHLMVLGVIFIVFVIFLPDGLCGLSRRAFIAFSGEVDTGSPQKTRQTQENSRRKASP
jgi:branched-chain amino acid transport system permease protein